MRMRNFKKRKFNICCCPYKTVKYLSVEVNLTFFRGEKDCCVKTVGKKEETLSLMSPPLHQSITQPHKRGFSQTSAKHGKIPFQPLYSCRKPVDPNVELRRVTGGPEEASQSG